MRRAQQTIEKKLRHLSIDIEKRITECNDDIKHTIRMACAIENKRKCRCPKSYNLKFLVEKSPAVKDQAVEGDTEDFMDEISKGAQFSEAIDILENSKEEIIDLNHLKVEKLFKKDNQPNQHKADTPKNGRYGSTGVVSELLEISELILEDNQQQQQQNYTSMNLEWNEINIPIIDENSFCQNIKFDEKVNYAMKLKGPISGVNGDKGKDQSKKNEVECVSQNQTDLAQYYQDSINTRSKDYQPTPEKKILKINNYRRCGMVTPPSEEVISHNQVKMYNTKRSSRMSFYTVSEQKVSYYKDEIDVSKKNIFPIPFNCPEKTVLLENQAKIEPYRESKTHPKNLNNEELLHKPIVSDRINLGETSSHTLESTIMIVNQASIPESTLIQKTLTKEQSVLLNTEATMNYSHNSKHEENDTQKHKTDIWKSQLEAIYKSLEQARPSSQFEKTSQTNSKLKSIDVTSAITQNQVSTYEEQIIRPKLSAISCDDKIHKSIDNILNNNNAPSDNNPEIQNKLAMKLIIELVNFNKLEELLQANPSLDASKLKQFIKAQISFL